jgi:hypothetical protein
MTTNKSFKLYKTKIKNHNIQLISYDDYFSQQLDRLEDLLDNNDDFADAVEQIGDQLMILESIEVAKDILLRTDLISQNDVTKLLQYNFPILLTPSTYADQSEKAPTNQDKRKQVNPTLILRQLFELTKTRADEKLQTSINDLKIDNIDKQLSDLIQLCSAHTSLKLRVSEFIFQHNNAEVTLESFNYSRKGASPESKIIMRDGQLHYFLTDETFPVASEIKDTHIAVMARRVRSAIAIINNSKLDQNDKSDKINSCVDLLKVFFNDVTQATDKKFIGYVEKFTKDLVQKLDNIQTTDGLLTGKKLDSYYEKNRLDGTIINNLKIESFDTTQDTDKKIVSFQQSIINILKLLWSYFPSAKLISNRDEGYNANSTSNSENKNSSSKKTNEEQTLFQRITTFFGLGAKEEKSKK